MAEQALAVLCYSVRGDGEGRMIWESTDMKSTNGGFNGRVRSDTEAIGNRLKRYYLTLFRVWVISKLLHLG